MERMFFTLNKTFLIYFAPRRHKQLSGIKKITCFSNLPGDNIKRSFNLRAARLRNSDFFNSSLSSFHLI